MTVAATGVLDPCTVQELIVVYVKITNIFMNFLHYVAYITCSYIR